MQRGCKLNLHNIGYVFRARMVFGFQDGWDSRVNPSAHVFISQADTIFAATLSLNVIRDEAIRSSIDRIDKFCSPHET